MYDLSLTKIVIFAILLINAIFVTANIARRAKIRNSRGFLKIRSSCCALLEMSFGILYSFANFHSFRTSIHLTFSGEQQPTSYRLFPLFFPTVVSADE